MYAWKTYALQKRRLSHLASTEETANILSGLYKIADRLCFRSQHESKPASILHKAFIRTILDGAICWAKEVRIVNAPYCSKGSSR